MSKERLKHSLEELFSDFSPPAPEGEAEPSGLPLHADVGVTEPPPEKETRSEPREEVDEGKDSDEGEEVSQENDSAPENNIRTWRAGWRSLATENTNGKGHADSARGSIGIKRRRLIDGKLKSGERER